MMPRLLLKVGALLMTSAMMAFVAIVVFGNVRFEDSTTYRALFADASGLVAGSDVRAAGVTVGRVSDVELTDSYRILVTFSVNNDVVLTRGIRAAIRYKNLVGDRYLQLSEGPGHPARLEQDDVIPLAQTEPALDLDELYNGFTPLLQGLDPKQVNQLSSALIGALQGEGPAIERLLSSVASLSHTVADRDAVIGNLIDNFNAVLDTANQRAPQLEDLIERLHKLIRGLSADRDKIGQSVVRIGDLADNVGGLLADARPDLRGSIRQVDRLASLLNSDRDLVETTLQRLPEAYRQLGRLGAYGSFFNFYLCSVRLRLTGPDGEPIETAPITSDVERCQ